LVLNGLEYMCKLAQCKEKANLAKARGAKLRVYTDLHRKTAEPPKQIVFYIIPWRSGSRDFFMKRESFCELRINQVSEYNANTK
jgi:hypothetical protein